MPFDTKKAVEAWKKAKPLTMTDTGVSDFLRKLPSAATPDKLPLLVAAQKQLDTFIANPKIGKDAKAKACLQQIKTDIKLFVDKIYEHRLYAARNITTTIKALDDYIATLTKTPITIEILKGYEAKVTPVLAKNDPVPRKPYDEAVPQEMFARFIAGRMNSESEYSKLQNLVVDLGRAPAQRVIKDPASAVKSYSNGFKLARDAMETDLKEIVKLK